MSKYRYSINRLKISTSTWKKDSYGLYDYHSSDNLHHSELQAEQPGIIYRENHGLLFATSDQNPDKKECLIMVPINDSGSYCINPHTAAGETQLWQPIHKNKHTHKLP